MSRHKLSTKYQSIGRMPRISRVAVTATTDYRSRFFPPRFYSLPTHGRDCGYHKNYTLRKQVIFLDGIYIYIMKSSIAFYSAESGHCKPEVNLLHSTCRALKSNFQGFIFVFSMLSNCVRCMILMHHDTDSFACLVF